MQGDKVNGFSVGIVGNGRRNSMLVDFLNEPKKQFKSQDFYRTKYGRYRGHYAWDLACHWFKTSNDLFFETYGFSYVPKGQLFNEAKEYVFHNS